MLLIQGLTDQFAYSHDGMSRHTKIVGPGPENYALHGVSHITVHPWACATARQVA
jgi:hypothetical protein